MTGRSLVAAAAALTMASVTLSACGSVSASAALGKWASSANVVRNDAQLTADARHALTALRDGRTRSPELRTVCAVLDYESLQAYASLPTPDDQTTQLLTTAYTDLGSGANECYRAAASTARRARAVADIGRAGAAFSEARARMSALGVAS